MGQEKSVFEIRYYDVFLLPIPFIFAFLLTLLSGPAFVGAVLFAFYACFLDATQDSDIYDRLASFSCNLLVVVSFLTWWTRVL